ncbi:hypothetical protein FRC12_021756 [Ceratobasidium sp. 428]|nr:hypothetical protein FRC12_021756 [Ceratobasidium sp. 428]
MFCCKEAPSADGHESGKGGVGKANPTKRRAGSTEMQNTIYLLKGRIFLNNVVKTSIVPDDYLLEIWWRGENDMEFMKLCCQNEEQRTLWQTKIDRQITESTARRLAERAVAASNRVATTPNQAAITPDHAHSYSPLLSAYLNSQARYLNNGAPKDQTFERTTPPEVKSIQPPERSRARVSGTDGPAMVPHRQNALLIPPTQAASMVNSTPKPELTSRSRTSLTGLRAKSTDKPAGAPASISSGGKRQSGLFRGISSIVSTKNNVRHPMISVNYTNASKSYSDHMII